MAAAAAPVAVRSSGSSSLLELYQILDCAPDTDPTRRDFCQMAVKALPEVFRRKLFARIASEDAAYPYVSRSEDALSCHGANIYLEDLPRLKRVLDKILQDLVGKMPREKQDQIFSRIAELAGVKEDSLAWGRTHAFENGRCLAAAISRETVIFRPVGDMLDEESAGARVLAVFGEEIFAAAGDPVARAAVSYTVKTVDIERVTGIERKWIGRDDLIAVIEKYPFIEHLDLSKCTRLHDSDLLFLRGLRHLKSLNLSGCLITNFGLRNLAGLTGLTSLNLSRCGGIAEGGATRLTDEGADHLAALTGLRELDLSHSTFFTAAGIARLNTLTNLTSLNLEGSWRSPEYMRAVVASFPNLTSLNLKRGRLSDEALSALAPLTRLESLNLESIGMSDESLALLAPFVRLQSLNLADNSRITSAGLALLAPFVHLRSLNLGYNSHITSEGLEVLARLEELRDLNLSCCERLTDDGMAHVARCKKLTSLNIAVCGELTDDGMAHVASCKNLTSLNIDRCWRITTKSMKWLATLRELKEFQFDETRIRDEVKEGISSKGLQRFFLYMLFHWPEKKFSTAYVILTPGYFD